MIPNAKEPTSGRLQPARKALAPRAANHWLAGPSTLSQMTGALRAPQLRRYPSANGNLGEVPSVAGQRNKVSLPALLALVGGVWYGSTLFEFGAVTAFYPSWACDYRVLSDIQTLGHLIIFGYPLALI